MKQNIMIRLDLVLADTTPEQADQFQEELNNFLIDQLARWGDQIVHYEISRTGPETEHVETADLEAR